MNKKERAALVIAIACILIALSILLTTIRGQRQRAFHPQVSHPALSTTLPVPMSILQPTKPERLSPIPGK